MVVGDTGRGCVCRVDGIKKGKRKRKAQSGFAQHKESQLHLYFPHSYPSLHFRHFLCSVLSEDACESEGSDLSSEWSPQGISS
jgi:hypothetical protein